MCLFIERGPPPTPAILRATSQEGLGPRRRTRSEDLGWARPAPGILRSLGAQVYVGEAGDVIAALWFLSVWVRVLGGFGDCSALAGAPHSRGLGDQLAGGHTGGGSVAGLSHMPGRCSRLSWAQLPLVSSLTLRGLQNKASLSVLGSYQDLEWGWGTPDPQSWPNQEESALCLHVRVRDGSRPQIPHPVTSWTQEGCEPLCHDYATDWSRARPGRAKWLWQPHGRATWSSTHPCSHRVTQL